MCCFLFSIAIAAPSLATEPLHDQFRTGDQTGWIFPSGCCWVKLPPSELLDEMKRKEMAGCSAIGGPVGKFELVDGKLWLTGLMKCSGDVRLHRVYPELDSPAFANWLSGTFKTRVDFLCYDKTVRPIYGLEQVLTVEQGVVTAITETKIDPATCPKKAGS